jgi:hypothetical protein
MEVFFAPNHDHKQRHDLVAAQLKDRQALQVKIIEVRDQEPRRFLTCISTLRTFVILKRTNRLGGMPQNPRHASQMG